VLLGEGSRLRPAHDADPGGQQLPEQQWPVRLLDAVLVHEVEELLVPVGLGSVEQPQLVEHHGSGSRLQLAGVRCEVVLRVRPARRADPLDHCGDLLLGEGQPLRGLGAVRRSPGALHTGAVGLPVYAKRTPSGDHDCVGYFRADSGQQLGELTHSCRCVAVSQSEPGAFDAQCPAAGR
jgi:hypothetical protein